MSTERQKSGSIGKSLDAGITIFGSPDDERYITLERYQSLLPELFIVSHVNLVRDSGPLRVEVFSCESLGHHRCPRCWRWVPALHTTNQGDICPRCVKVFD